MIEIKQGKTDVSYGKDGRRIGGRRKMGIRIRVLDLLALFLGVSIRIGGLPYGRPLDNSDTDQD